MWTERLRRAINRCVTMLPAPLARALTRLTDRVRVLLLGPHVWALVVRNQFGLLLVETMDDSVGGGLRLQGVWQPECVNALLQRTDRDSRVLVVGAHLGALVLPLARKAHSVAAVEPNPITLEYLTLNVRLNALDNVEIHPFAAGDRDGPVTFAADRHYTGGSHVTSPNLVYDGGQTLLVEVPMRRLDDVFRGRRFDVVLVDAEGSEPYVVEGAHAVLEDAQVLLIEIHPGLLRRVPQGDPRLLAAALARHFKWGVRLDGQRPPSAWFSTDQLHEVIAAIFAEGFITDLLLVKTL
ncbi:MAG: FkbM family methyltransferase [Candidatus Eremiobacterota bacterium]